MTNTQDVRVITHTNDDEKAACAALQRGSAVRQLEREVPHRWRDRSSVALRQASAHSAGGASLSIEKPFQHPFGASWRRARAAAGLR
jgi:hypothetical protein